MTSLTSTLLLVAVAVVAAARLTIPLCHKWERNQQATAREAGKAAVRLQKRLRPGTYTFGWTKGRLTEPTVKHSTSRSPDDQVVIEYFNDDQKTSDITKMPYQFQKQFLRQVNKALVHAPLPPQNRAKQ